MRLAKNLATTIAHLSLAVFLLSALTTWADSSDIDSIIMLRVKEAQDAYRHGNFEGALLLSQQAIKPSRPDDKASDQYDALIIRAEAYRALGQYQNALNILKTLQTALVISKNKPQQIRLFDMMGDIYGNLGRIQQAKTLLSKGISLAEELQEPSMSASMHNNLGKILANNGDLKQARHHLQSSIKFATQVNDAQLQATATLNLARLELKAKNIQLSQDLLHKALNITKRLEKSHDQAFLLINTGRLSQQIKAQLTSKETKWDKLSYNAYKDAHNIAEKTGDTRVSVYALGYLGQLYHQQKRYQEALQLTNRAIFSTQQLNMPEILYLWQWQAAKLLHTMGNNEDAIDSYRRAVHTLKSVRRDLSVSSDKKYASFREHESLIFFEFTDLLLQSQNRLNDPDKMQQYLVEARETMEQLKTVELQDYFQDDCVTELQSRITQLDTVSASTAVFYPILLQDRIELLLTLPAGIKQYTVPISKKMVTKEIRLFRRQLEKRTTHQYMAQAKQLYQWLIEPMQKDLESNNIQTLVIVPDSALRTIPLAALHTGKHFLINQYAIATTPGLTLTDPKPLKRTNMSLLLNGLTQSVQGFPALPNVNAELNAISKLYNSTILKDDTYLIASVEKELSATSFRAIHIASHGQFKSNPKDSFLLTYDNKLNMDKLKQMMGISKYRDEPVELLTLSACQTAAGDDRAALGLAGIAVKAGARSALATLWFINDQASSQLITDFYTQLKNSSLSKAKALQKAQVKMISDKRYKHPSYWAPFLLIGNWL